MGIPFTKKPTALQYDYKVRLADRPNRIRATGFGRDHGCRWKRSPHCYAASSKKMGG